MGQELKVYKLKHPVTVGERTCAELKLCRPKMKDFIAVGNEPPESGEALTRLMSSISGEPYAVVSQIDIDDFFYLRIEAARIWQGAFFTGEYELNPPPPPPETEAAEAENTTAAQKSTAALPR